MRRPFPFPPIRVTKMGWGVFTWGELMGRLGVLFFCGIAGVITTAAPAAIPMESPQVIEAYGDSLTKAFLSNTSLTEPPAIDEIGSIYTDLINFKLRNDRSYLERHEPAALSWPVQLAQMLYPGEPIPVRNAAVTGARTDYLEYEVQSLGSAQNALSFIFVGHNDMCGNPASSSQLAAQYRGYLDRALSKWEATHKNSQLFLLPIGEIFRVYETLQGVVWQRSSERTFTCEDSWRKLFPWCPSYYRKFAAGTLKAELEPKLEAMDDELEAIAASKVSSKGNRYHYLKGIQKADYDVSEFAVDCFHLSAQGQKALARAVYQGMFLD